MGNVVQVEGVAVLVDLLVCGEGGGCKAGGGAQLLVERSDLFQTCGVQRRQPTDPGELSKCRRLVAAARRPVGAGRVWTFTRE